MTEIRRPWEPSSISTDPEQWYAVLEWEMNRSLELEHKLEEAEKTIAKWTHSYGQTKSKLIDAEYQIERLQSKLRKSRK